jgi:hypothetical protein
MSLSRINEAERVRTLRSRLFPFLALSSSLALQGGHYRRPSYCERGARPPIGVVEEPSCIPARTIRAEDASAAGTQIGLRACCQSRRRKETTAEEQEWHLVFMAEPSAEQFVNVRVSRGLLLPYTSLQFSYKNESAIIDISFMANS